MTLFIGKFEREEDILGAAEATRIEGYDIYEAYTPYAVHGLDEALGYGKNRLPWVCLGFALLGLGFALWFQYWIGAIDWPLNVGGRPFNSLPAYLPVTFELLVLFSGIGVVITMLVRNRLYPGKKAQLIDKRVTNDRFVLVVRERDASFESGKLRDLWENYHAVEVRETEGAGR